MVWKLREIVYGAFLLKWISTAFLRDRNLYISLYWQGKADNVRYLGHVRLISSDGCFWGEWLKNLSRSVLLSGENSARLKFCANKCTYIWIRMVFPLFSGKRFYGRLVKCHVTPLLSMATKLWRHNYLLTDSPTRRHNAVAMETKVLTWHSDNLIPTKNVLFPGTHIT